MGNGLFCDRFALPLRGNRKLTDYRLPITRFYLY
jgi:hypothetical protein